MGGRATKKKSANVALVALMVAGVAVGGLAFGLARQEETRSIRASTGRSIVQQLRPGDKEVIVTSTRPPSQQIQPPPGVDPVAWMAGRSDVVLRVEILHRTGRLSEAQDWVVSDVEAVVVDVLKSDPRVSLKAGSMWTITMDGGEVLLGDVKIRARLQWARDPTVGRRYIVFGWVDEAGELVAGPSVFYEEADGQLVSLRTQGSDRMRRFGPTAAAIARIRGGGTQ